MRVDDKRIRFSHDKIQQAAYEMIPMQQRLENHMRFGLAICSHTFDTSGGKDDELFYTAVNQINRGGADCLSDSRQRVMVAALNLKAGQRSLELSDFSTALKLFEHGISFLDGNEQWTSHYNLSLQLFDAAVETACALSDTQAVTRLSQQVPGVTNDVLFGSLLSSLMTSPHLVPTPRRSGQEHSPNPGQCGDVGARESGVPPKAWRVISERPGAFKGRRVSNRSQLALAPPRLPPLARRDRALGNEVRLWITARRAWSEDGASS